MNTINWVKGSESGTKRVNPMFAERTIAQMIAAGYTVLTAAPVAVPVETTTAAQTGRVGKGLAVHRITAGHAVCGASFRRNSLGSSTRQVEITGEEVTCTACRTAK